MAVSSIISPKELLSALRKARHWLKSINIASFLVTLSLLSSCNDLAVFMPLSKAGSSADLENIEINENGQLAMTWTSKGQSSSGSYDIYLMEVENDDANYRFSTAISYQAPLSFEKIKVKGSVSPLKMGARLTTVKDLSFVLDDLLEVNKIYAIQISDGRFSSAQNDVSVLLVQIDFTKMDVGSAASADGYIHLVWNKVPGANRYEVYSDESMTMLIGQSTSNELTLKADPAHPLKDFYVKAFRGMLADSNTTKISLNASIVKVSKLTAQNPDGFYKVGDVLDIAAIFTGPVTSYGSVSLPLKTISRVRMANYASGSSSKTLNFQYTIQPGDDTERLASESVLQGEFVDNSGLLVSGNLPAADSSSSLKNSSNIIIDTINPTKANSVGFTSAYNKSGDFSISWTASADLHFMQHRLKICSDIHCSASCSSEQLFVGNTYNLTGVPEGLYYACVLGEDRAGNMSAWSSSLTPIKVDKTAPAIMRVYSQSSNGSYAAGSVLSLVVKFNEPVLVNGDLGLVLATGGTPQRAIYASGNGSDTLLFSYTVQVGDQSLDLNYVDSTSLGFQGVGSLTDLAGNNADITLPATNSSNSLAGQSAIVLDGIAPFVNKVYAVSANGSYKDGVSLTIAVEFSEPVTLSNASNLRLRLATGATTRYANYQGGDGSNVLNFTYLVGIGDENTDLDYSATSALAFNGSGSMSDIIGNSADLTLPSPGTAMSLAGQSQILIDAVSPTVSRVYSETADGIWGESATIVIAVEMSETVTVSNSANLKLKLETGSVKREASYDSGSGSNILKFSYQVVLGDVAGDLDYFSTSALYFNGAGSIVDALSNPAILTLPATGSFSSLSGQSSISIDTSDLKIDRIYATTANGIYKAGDVIDIAVDFNKIVDVIDSANLRLTLATGIIQQNAIYQSGSGTSTLAFRYTVQNGDLSPDLNYYSSTSLSFHNGSSGTVKDQSNQVATLFLPNLANSNSLAGQSAIVIDAVAPTVAKVYAVTANGAYRAGSVLTLAVEFTESVTLSGAGSLLLNLASGTPAQDAQYQSPLDGKTLQFSYTVQASDSSLDLDYSSTSALSKIGSISIVDQAGNEATLTLPAPAAASSLAGQSNIILDNSPPTVAKVYAQTANGSYRVGTTLSIAVEFNEAVTVGGGGSISLALATGTVHNASYASGSGSNTLVFSYPIVAGDIASDLDYVATSSLTLSGGATIKDAAGNDAQLALPTPASSNSLAGQSNIVIDTAAPSVQRIYAVTANGSYTVPQNIQIAVEFSEAVTVTDSGNLRLSLATGSPTRNASYQSGSGSSSLLLVYTVQAGDVSGDLNYVDTSSLSFISSGSIQDLVGNPAVMTLPALASANSLAGQSAIVIDTVESAPVFSSPIDNASLSSPITALSGTSEANATIQLYKNGVSLGTTTSSGAGVWSYTLSSAVLANGSYSFGAKATDVLGNSSNTTTIDVTLNIPLPTANAGVDILSALPSTLSGATTHAVSVQWSKESGPGTVSFGSANSDATTLSVSADGVYVLRLTATNVAGISVYDEMTFTFDTTAPTFSGITDIWQESATEVRFFWSAALDSLTAHKDIRYELCYGSSLGSCATSFVASETFDASHWEKTISGLTSGTVYEFMVRAIDLAGNISYGNGAIRSGGLQNVKQLSAGGQATCALLLDGTVKCWGQNNYYQLGQGGTSTTEKNSPVLVPGLSGVKKIALGIDHACAIMNDDTVKCWGNNNNGRLGDGTTTSRSSPVAVSGVSNVVDISAGEMSSCALNSSGNVMCWGRNDVGQLGNNSTTDSSTAVSVQNVSNAISIASGHHHSCAILNDKSMKCWGKNHRGQVGNNSTSSALTGTSVSLSNVVNIELGEAFSCAVVQSGAVYCWGYGGEGQIGVGSSSDKYTPTAVPSITSGASAMASGYAFTCALLTAGTVKCWGNNGYGQLGNDTLATSDVPVSVQNLSGVVSLAASNDGMCALLSDGRTKCWGRDDLGQLGNGKLLSRQSPGTVQGVSDVVSVQAGTDHSCALLSDKTVKCWGSNQYGQLGSGATGSDRNLYYAPRLVPGLSGVDLLKVGSYHNCALLSDSSVRCWGINSSGQLGNGNTTNQMTPQTVVSTSGSASLSGVADLVLGNSISCAILSGGSMNCWGSSGVGMLGDGRSSVISSIPIDSIQFTGPIKKAVAGYNHLCMLLDDIPKTVKCVGKNDNRQLGDSTTTNRSSPVTTLQGVADISSYKDHSCALMTDSTVKCWGVNSVGELGVGNFNTYATPQTTIGITNAVAIKSGGSFSCALLSDNTMKCWGEDDYGRLGYPYLTGNQNSPLPFAGMTQASSNFSLGYGHGCMVMADNTVKCWGYNNKGQVGINQVHSVSMTPDAMVISYSLGD